MPVAFISHHDCLLHEMGRLHPEQPDRLRVIEQAVRESSLNSKMRYYAAPLVRREQLFAAHDEHYIEQIFSLAPQQGYVALDEDTLMNPYTLKAALRAAGAVVRAVDLVMHAEVRKAFCNVRPPGHHAGRSKAAGFCFFNNVAVGVAHALQHYHARRVAIVDFDVHHGNGTEEIFLNEQRVLYCSSFQAPFYPFSGEETNSVHIRNVPLPVATSSKQFREKIASAWFVALEKFAPEIIFFSAGFDGFKNDGMAGLLLDEDDFFWLSAEICAIADRVSAGKTVSVLEGGYDLAGLGGCVLAHLRALVRETGQSG